MGIKIDVSRCTACMACELACGSNRDDAFALLSSCIVVYRGLEKKNYFGVLLKEEDSLVVARPEGLEIKQLGVVDEDNQDEEKGETDASAKPMLLREACDLCSDLEGGPICVRFCPVDAISVE